MAVSLLTGVSDSFGNGIVVPGTAVVMNNRRVGKARARARGAAHL